MSKLNNILLEGLSEIVKKTIIICADLYKFDAAEAMSKIGLEDVIDEKEEVRKEEVRKEKKEKKTEKKTEKTEIPLPYSGVENEECCNGLKYNHGLYTQCKVRRKGSESYCKMCENQASKHSHGKPTYGTIEDRLAVGIMEYVDPSGKKPEKYMNVLKKLNITVDESQEEASKQKIKINEIHFEEEIEEGIVATVTEKGEKPKGRPKKSKKVLEVANDENEDLIDVLLEEAKKKQLASEADVLEESEKKKREAEKEAKEAEKKKKEEEKEAKEAEKKKKEAEKEAKEAEKKKKEAEKEAKEAEKKKKEEEKEAKEAEKKKKEEKKKREAEAAEKKQKEAEEAEKKQKEEKGEKVKKINYKDGNIYLKSRVGIVYNTNQEEVGKWNDITGEIDFNKEKEDGELSEEEYEEEEEEEEELEDLKNSDNEEEDEEDDE